MSQIRNSSSKSLLGLGRVSTSQPTSIDGPVSSRALRTCVRAFFRAANDGRKPRFRCIVSSCTNVSRILAADDVLKYIDRNGRDPPAVGAGKEQAPNLASTEGIGA